MKGTGLRNKAGIETDLSNEEIEKALFSKDGMDLDDFLANTKLTEKFKRAGLYIISVNIPQYHNYIKIGLSSNLVARLMGHRTTLYPISAMIRLHCLAIKRNDLNPEESGTKKVSFMYKAEQRVKTELAKLNLKPLGEWYQIAIPKLTELFLNLHFGDEEEKYQADGYSCLFYIFNTRRCYEVKKTVWGEIKADALRRSGRNAKNQTVGQILKKFKKGRLWYFKIKYISTDGTESPVVEVKKAEVQKLAPDMLKDFERELLDNGDDEEVDEDYSLIDN
jgi:T5orf172 domain